MAENLNTSTGTNNPPEQQPAATNQVLDWVRLAVRRKARKEHQQLLREELRASRAKETAYRNMAQFAISFAAQEETIIPQRRFMRRQQLASMWRNMQQRLAFKTGRGW